MARSGLTRETVIQAAVNLIHHRGLDDLTLLDLASIMGVKPPSLYNHIRGITDLRRELSMHALEKMTEVAIKALHKKKERSAIRSFSKAYRNYAKLHPGLYHLGCVYPSMEDTAWHDIYMKYREEFTRCFSSYQMPEATLRNTARSLRSLMHGFVLFEINDSWLQSTNTDTTYEYAIKLFCDALESRRNLKIKNAK